MLEKPLRLLDEVFPASGPPVTQEVWSASLPRFCEELALVAEELFSVVKLTVPNRLLAESKQEIVVSRNPVIVVSEYRLRPETSYYTKTGRPIPSPENPEGPDATGIELNLSLCRGYRARKTVRLPWLSIELSVWGRHERSCFHELFIEHRRLVERFLSAPGLEFSTACVFDNVDRAKGASVFKKLDLYYQNKTDDENNFTIEQAFGVMATKAELVGTLLPLAALYDAAYGYCLPAKARDRILDYVSLVHDEI